LIGMTLRRLAFAAVALPLACHGASDPSPPGIAPCDELHWTGKVERVPVVLVLNDTMRRDRMGVEGGAARTPAFDRFARENLLFDRAYTQAPWTRPAVASLFTSLYPSQHGMVAQVTQDGGFVPLRKDLVTLAEVLKKAGYRTAAFVGNPWLVKPLGLERGFDVYDDDFASWDADGLEICREARGWLETAPAGEPFFLYVHTMDSHQPYPALSFEEVEAQSARLAADRQELSPQVRAQIAGRVRIESADPLLAHLVQPSRTLIQMAYEKGIGRFDRALACLLDGIGRSWAAATAAVIVTSDHGEALFDRGYGGHGQGLYDDELAVPLAARLPDVTGPAGPIRCPVGLIDVLPTLCDYLGIDCPAGAMGQSWLPDARRGDERRFLFAEGVGGQPEHRAIRDDRYKLMWQPGRPPDGYHPNPLSLYDELADPGEREDRIDDPELAHRIERLTERLHTGLPPPATAGGEKVRVDPAVLERLRELGYER
jgi:arylsulfatase A-like enzyme